MLFRTNSSYVHSRLLINVSMIIYLFIYLSVRYRRGKNGVSMGTISTLSFSKQDYSCCRNPKQEPMSGNPVVYFTTNPSGILWREWRPYRAYRRVIKLNHNGPIQCHTDVPLSTLLPIRLE